MLTWLSKSSNYEMISGLFGGIKDKVLTKKDPAHMQFRPLEEHESEDNRLHLEGDDDQLRHDAEDPSESDETRGKRMTKRQGLDAAQKRVPILSKPGEKGGASDAYI